MATSTICCVFVILSVLAWTSAKEINYFDLNITQIIPKIGYPVETHHIETEDGYLLDIYRIPYGANSTSKQPNQKPVLLTHGLLGSAENFIWFGPNISLGYVLADRGYDVWLFNARGTWHSRKHKTLDPDRNSQYWKFSWHEIGMYDVPATIDYILKITNKKKLHYIGHSQGSTSFFVMCSERPEYNEKIHVMVALAPSAIYKHTRHQIYLMLAPFHRLLEQLVNVLNIQEIPGGIVSNDLMRSILKSVCGQKNSPLGLCHFIFIILGGSTTEIDAKMLPYVASNLPGGASARQGIHYIQLINSGKFRNYDWGSTENLRRYKSTVPPSYDLGKVTAPVALFYAVGDELVVHEDVELVAKALPNVVELYSVPYTKWNHIDFVWGKNLDTLLNNEIIECLSKYGNK